MKKPLTAKIFNDFHFHFNIRSGGASAAIRTKRVEKKKEMKTKFRKYVY